MKSTTSSFRISEELRVRLERTTRYLKRGKNWIPNRALEEYLNREDVNALSGEASEAVIAGEQYETEDERFWEKHADTTGWK